LDGDTPATSTSSEFIIYMAKQGGEAVLGEGGSDIVILRNRRNL
jgi:hypothetical protein